MTVAVQRKRLVELPQAGSLAVTATTLRHHDWDSAITLASASLTWWLNAQSVYTMGGGGMNAGSVVQPSAAACLSRNATHASVTSGAPSSPGPQWMPAHWFVPAKAPVALKADNNGHWQCWLCLTRSRAHVQACLHGTFFMLGSTRSSCGQPTAGRARTERPCGSQSEGECHRQLPQGARCRRGSRRRRTALPSRAAERGKGSASPAPLPQEQCYQRRRGESRAMNPSRLVLPHTQKQG